MRLIEQLWFPGAVRVRACSADPFAGLKGHAYIKARGLNVKVARIGPMDAHSRWSKGPGRAIKSIAP